MLIRGAEMARMQHNSIRCHYDLIGSGPVVAFAHGLTGDLDRPRQLVAPPDGYSGLFGDARGDGLGAREGISRTF